MNTPTSVPVLAISGYSGSGKTTVIEGLVPELRGRGYRVGVIKHHCHHLVFDVEGKDSHKFWQSGADAVAMLSRDRTVLMWRAETSPGLRDLASLMPVDLVLAEGFKDSDLPRVVVVGDDHGAAEKLARGGEVVAVVASAGVWPWPTCSPDDSRGLADIVEAWLRRSTAAPG